MASKFTKRSGISIYEIPETKFHRWTTKGPVFRSLGRSWVVCQCECGTFAVVMHQYMYRDDYKSCGCLRAETIGMLRKSHGETSGYEQSPEWTSWMSMIDRCRNENNRAFKDYGGRGIRVCERWQSYENFIADVGRRPSPEHSIDRIEVNGNYEPGNCRWATYKEQANNKRCNRIIEYDGESKTLSEWVDAIGVVHYKLAWERLRNGWSFEAALKTPRKNCFKTRSN